MITLLRRPGLKLLEARLQAVLLHKHTLAPPHFDTCRSLSIHLKNIFIYLSQLYDQGLNPDPPALEVQSPNHRTAREFPEAFLKQQLYQGKIHIQNKAFNGYNPVVYSVFRELCYHVQQAILDHFHHLQNVPISSHCLQSPGVW